MARGTCPICGKFFDSTLSMHLMHIHGVQFSHPIPGTNDRLCICGRRFTVRRNLEPPLSVPCDWYQPSSLPALKTHLTYAALQGE